MNPLHPFFYYPTTSPQANYELSILNYPLFSTFSAKEKDPETGYSYFGARYYESGLSIWLSVDPLSDKYPSLSPYVYCANNPVILVDPDGRDIWSVDDLGYFSLVEKTDDDFDVLVTKSSLEGGDKKEITVDKGVLQNPKDFSVKDKGGDTHNINFVEVKGDEKAAELFTFLADNTDVEWTHAKIGTEKSGSNIIGTSHSESSTPVGHFLRQTGYTLREVNHNHPSGDPFPSGNDFSGGAEYEKVFPNIILKTYVNGRGEFPKGYYLYDSEGPKWGKQ